MSALSRTGVTEGICITPVSRGCATAPSTAQTTDCPLLAQAVTRRLWKVLKDGDLINSAIEQTCARLAERTNEQTSEREAVQRKLTETRSVMDRYFRVLEKGNDARGHLRTAHSRTRRTG